MVGSDGAGISGARNWDAGGLGAWRVGVVMTMVLKVWGRW